MKTHYKTRTWKPHHIWWAEKKAAERRAKERYEWEAARDESIQCAMLFKERAEDFCSCRITEIAGANILQLREGDDPFEAFTCVADYEHAIIRLQRHIPHLEFDPRIVSDLQVNF